MATAFYRINGIIALHCNLAEREEIAENEFLLLVSGFRVAVQFIIRFVTKQIIDICRYILPIGSAIVNGFLILKKNGNMFTTAILVRNRLHF